MQQRMKSCARLLLFIPALASAQVFDGADAPAAAPAAAPKEPAKVLGNVAPHLDPGGEMLTFDGKMWSVTNQRLFLARFEKYLAAPESKAVADLAYRAALKGALDALRPNNPGGPDTAAAMRHVLQAAKHPDDAGLCDTLAQTVYGTVLHRRHESRLSALNTVLEKEAMSLTWDIKVSGKPTMAETNITNQTKGKDGSETTTTSTLTDLSRTSRYAKKTIELDATRAANSAKIGASEISSKLEFQALIVQFFLQRRYEHVSIACRLYRNLYEDGSAALELKKGSDVEKMFVNTTGITPTVAALDALSGEFMREVDEGVQSYEFLHERGDLQSASQRLSEAFMLGEYLPRIRTLPRPKKEKVVAFVRDASQLISCLEVKDYTLAETLVERLRQTAKDFDYSKPRAAIETARATASLHIQSARSAAIQKNDAKVAIEVEKAALVWPTNPDLKAFSTQVATYGDMNSRVLNDLDTLIGQKNYREIFREQVKYAGAVLGRPEYEAKLKDVMEKMSGVERAVATADELVKSGDAMGAWERLSRVAPDFPDDNEINRRRADLSAKSPEFIRAITEAQKFEESGRLGMSLSWFLGAKRLYPASLYAKEGISRLADKLVPESK
jgi:hypothetical protein